MNSLKLFLLGSPRLERDDEPLKIEARKNIALLAYLAITGEHHSREALVTLLWPELDPSRARAGLRRNLSTLKKTIGDQWLLIDRETIGLSATGGIWSDVGQFRDLLAESKRHDHQDGEVCPHCLAVLTEAVELYRGDFLEGFSLRDSPGFDDWQFFQTESLCEELAAGLEQLAGLQTTLGDYGSAIPYARRWLDLDTLHEPAHRQLMKLYAWSNQRAAALRQYDECKRILEDELSVSPEEDTTLLYQAIKSKSIFPPQVQTASPQKASPRGDLPIQPTPFVGRKAELTALLGLLISPDVRLVTIFGGGGMGKSRLALEAAGALSHSFSDGVYFVSLASLESAEGIVPTVAKVLDFSFYERSHPEQQLLDHLSQVNLLLIMDNFEHLLEGADWVTEVLMNTTNVKILTTSRARLNVQGEHLYPILGMDFPQVLSALTDQEGFDESKEVNRYGAVQLFWQAARRVQPGFRLTATNYHHVVRICHLVDGMPLAILLAAAWVDMLPIADIAAEIDKGVDFLETDMRDMPERQRSLQAVFAHSFCTLSQQEQEMFQVLSVFRGGFTRKAAEDVVGGSLLDLRSLVDKALLNCTPTGRYVIHELLRQYAGEKLEDSPTAYKAAREGHATYYLNILREQALMLKGPQAQSALLEIDTESQNVRSAWNWAAREKRVDLLESALEGLFTFYLWRRRYQEGESACRMAVKYLSPIDTDDGRRLLASLYMWEGSFSLRLDRIGLANQRLQDSMALQKVLESEGMDMRQNKASLLLQMAYTTFDIDLRDANQLSEASLFLFREMNDSWGTANAMSSMGWAAMSSGNYSKARELFLESLTIRHSLGDQRGIIDSLGGLTFTAFFAGQYKGAEEYIRQTISFLQEYGVQADIYDRQSTGGDQLKIKVESAPIELMHQESLGFYSDIGFSHSYGPSNSALGTIKKHLGQYDEALRQAQIGIAFGNKVGWRSEVALSLQLLGDLALSDKSYAEAHKHYEKSISLYRQTRVLELSDALVYAGIAALGLGDYTQTQLELYEALRMASEIQTQFPLTSAIVGAALLKAELGEGQRAVELYALASRYPYIANSFWFADIAGGYIENIATTLPSEVVVAARERGRCLKLETTVAEILDELGR
jgi:predicted ATPase/DNA-binding SARP family transcriptional activator